MRDLRTAIANATMRHYLNAIRENESSVAVVPSTYDGQKVIDTETQIKTAETLNYVIFWRPTPGWVIKKLRNLWTVPYSKCLFLYSLILKPKKVVPTF